LTQAQHDDFQLQLLATFEVEAQEHLQAINGHLLALEQARGAVPERLLAELFREAHSLKGAARAVALPEVEALAHVLEELFSRIRDGRKEADRETLDTIFRTLDSIEAALGPGPPTMDPGSESAAPPPGPQDELAVTWGGQPRVPEETVRIATSKLDALMAEVGELLVTRIGTEQRLGDVRALESALANWDAGWRKVPRLGTGPNEAGTATALLEEGTARLHAIRGDVRELRRRLEADVRRMEQVTGDLQDDVRRARMLPIATMFRAFSRMVRDLARDRGKEVTLTLTGSETEVDRSVLEHIKDPLTHLLRNCVDHGIEAPELRAEAGKPAWGTISLSAHARGDALVIVVADDGAGIDLNLVRRAAGKSGVLSPAGAAELPDRQAMSLIFRSGLSTSPIITDLSGRGIGLDVVRETVERLHGSIEVDSRTGQGTTFTLSLPLSVSTKDCLLIHIAGQTFALPVSSVERIIRAGAGDIERAEGREVVRVDGSPVALARLSDLLGLEAAPVGVDARSKRPVIVVGSQERRMALLVDDLTRTHEVVIKTLPEPLSRVRHFAGATILGSGEVAMLLSAADLMTSVEPADRPPLQAAGAVDGNPSSILVVEDSITTRTLEKSILEAAGYRVEVAADGAEAWGLLQASGYDLVVSDIEMPEVDGFELIAKIRSDPRHRDLPLVLVTSRESREDRERGIQAGADAYIVKGAFDQDRLLETIRRLI
jgi:two-component system, chemotaxis family, sensor kinase CheA